MKVIKYFIRDGRKFKFEKELTEEEFKTVFDLGLNYVLLNADIDGQYIVEVIDEQTNQQEATPA